MTTPNFTTPSMLKAQPVLVIWQVEDARVEVKPDGLTQCACDTFKKNRAMWGEGYCPHTQAVQAERERRGFTRKH